MEEKTEESLYNAVQRDKSMEAIKLGLRDMEEDRDIENIFN